MHIIDSSSDGRISAVASKNKIVIYNIGNNTSEVFIQEEVEGIKTKMIKISPSGTCVGWLCFLPNLFTLINLFSMTKTNIQCTENFYFDYVMWSPDGNVLALFSNLSVFTDLYSVVENCVNHIATIQGAKVDQFGSPIAQFSSDGNYFCNVNVCSQGCSFTVYSSKATSWNCIQRVLVSECLDVGGLLWCQDKASLLLWQSNLELRLQLWTLDGRREHQLVMPDAPPVTSVCLSTCGRMAAVHSANGMVEIIDLLTWKLGDVSGMVHCPILHNLSGRSRLKETISSNKTQVSICKPMTESLSELIHMASKVNHHQLQQFSADAQYLATYEPIFPNTLWIWNLCGQPLLDTTVVLGDDSFVYELLWHSHKSYLAASLSQNRVLVWTTQQTTILSQEKHSWPLNAQTYFASCDNLD